jgi:hypothetical protein
MQCYWTASIHRVRYIIMEIETLDRVMTSKQRRSLAKSGVRISLPLSTSWYRRLNPSLRLQIPPKLLVGNRGARIPHLPTEIVKAKNYHHQSSDRDEVRGKQTPSCALDHQSCKAYHGRALPAPFCNSRSISRPNYSFLTRRAH